MEQYPEQDEAREEGASNTNDVPILLFDEEDVEDAVAACANIIVGEFMTTEKPMHKDSLQSSLSNIWCNLAGFKIEEV